MSQGFYAAAVAAIRLRLELVAVAYYRTVIQKRGHGLGKRPKPPFCVVVMHLAEMGEIDHPLRNKLKTLYAQASHVVHGDSVLRHEAKTLNREVERAIAELRGGASC